MERTEVEIEMAIDRHVQSIRAKVAVLDKQGAALGAQLADATETISGLAADVSQRDELKSHGRPGAGDVSNG